MEGYSKADLARMTRIGYSDNPDICWCWGCDAPATFNVKASPDGEIWLEHTMCAHHAIHYVASCPYADIRSRVAMPAEAITADFGRC